MSGSTIGGFAGAAIGFWFGGPQGAQWGFMAGSMIGGAVDPDVIQGPRLTDAQTQTSNEGVPRPIIYGTAAVAGNIIQVGPLVEHKTSQRAGKGGPVQETYTYTRDVAIRISEAAPLGGSMKLLRVWKNDKLVADFTEANTIPADTAAFSSILTFYSGDEDQLPDPTLEALAEEYGGGVGNVPAYRGTCYAVLTGLDVTETGGAVPQFRWEVSSTAEETPEVCYPSNWIVLGHRNSTQSVMFKSDDLETWTRTDVPGGGHLMARNGDEILIAGTNTAHFSSDGGQSWTACTGLPTNTIVGAVYSNGAWLLPTNLNNVSRSTDGINFTYANEGTTYAVAANETRCVRAAYQAFVSTDGGQTWAAAPDTSTFGGKAPIGGGIAASKDFFIVVTAGFSAGGVPRIWRSEDGLTWEGLDTSPWPDTASITNVSYDRANHRWGITSGRDFAYSMDNGDSWTLIPNAIPAGRGAQAGDGLRGYAGKWVIACGGTTNAPVMVSTDGGLSWAEQVPTGSNYNVTAVDNDGVPVDGVELPDQPGYFLQPDGTILSNCTPGVVLEGAESLGAIITDLCGRAGIDTTQIDVSALAGITVRGFPVARQTSAAEAVRALQQVYFFDLPEWGNSGDTGTKLRAVLRGGSVVSTITDDDLVDTDDDESTRAQQVEFPRKVNLTASDPESNYEPITQPAERSTENVKAVGEASFSTNVVMTREECAIVADKLLKAMWEAALGRRTLELPEAFTYLTPSDRISYGDKQWHIDKAELLDGSVKLDLTRDRASAYASTATGSPVLPPTAPPSSIRGPTMFEAMNLPRLRSQDTTPGMYVAVCGLLPGWAGCDLYLSVDDGVTEQLVATLDDAATMGTLTADLAAAGTPLSVSLYGGELDSVTVDQLLARLNAAAVTTDEVSEILQFQTATETGTRTYDLTDLTRGELYTEAADHDSGDPFVLLDAAVAFVPLDIGLAGKTLIFRPVSRGTAPANNATYSVVFRPQFTGPQEVEAYTDDAGNVYTDDADNPYYYEVPPT